MIIVLPGQLTAIQLSPVARFNAPDPWHGDVPADWTLSVYRMTPEQNAGLFTRYSEEKQKETADGQNLDADDTLGIRSAPGDPYRLLPIAMRQLWQQGKLPDEALPRLIAGMQLRLKPHDYVAPATARRWMPVFRWGTLVLGSICTAVGMYNGLIAHVQDSGLVAGLILTGFIFFLCAGAAFFAGRRRGAALARQQRQILTML